MKRDINREEIKQLILLNKKYNGELTLRYVPSSKLNSVEELYGLYYGGCVQIGLGSYFRYKGDFIKIDDSNIDSIVDKTYKCLCDDIGDEILESLKNLNLQEEYLKYFNKETDMYNKFKKEVLRLKNNK